MEISLGNSSIVDFLETEVAYEQKFINIDEIKDGMNGVNISGVILDISDVRTFSRKDGTEGTSRWLNRQRKPRHLGGWMRLPHFPNCFHA